MYDEAAMKAHLKDIRKKNKATVEHFKNTPHWGCLWHEGTVEVARVKFIKYTESCYVHYRVGKKYYRRHVKEIETNRWKDLFTDEMQAIDAALACCQRRIKSYKESIAQTRKFERNLMAKKERRNASRM